MDDLVTPLHHFGQRREVMLDVGGRDASELKDASDVRSVVVGCSVEMRLDGLPDEVVDALPAVLSELAERKALRAALEADQGYQV
jgi:hypothetical protein